MEVQSLLLEVKNTADSIKNICPMFHCEAHSISNG